MADRYKWILKAWVDKVLKGSTTETVGATMNGFPSTPLAELFNFNDSLNYQIPVEYTYRPDLIAYKFYRDPKLFWVLVYANNFKNSPEDFSLGTVIKIPKFEKVIGKV
jgi:hypothetical protein